MTEDLERHWDDLPVGDAPIDAILRAARRKEAHRSPERRLKRSLLLTAAAGGIAAAFVVGTLVAQPGSPGGGPGDGVSLDSGLAPVAFHGELQAAASCDDLLAHYVDRAIGLVGPAGWASRDVQFNLSLTSLRDTNGSFAFQNFAADARAPRGAENVAKTTTSVNSATGTNVQESGVDEPDVVKTDGRLIARVDDAVLTTYDVTDAGVTEAGRLDLGDLDDAEILLAGDAVVAIGHTRDATSGTGQPPRQTRVVTVDVSDTAAPRLVETVDYDTALVTARQHGDAVRLVLGAGLPDLDFVAPESSTEAGRTAALTANQQVVRDSTIDDWLPHVTTSASTDQLVACDRVALPRADLGLGTMAVVGFDAGAPAELSTLGLAGDAPLAYESPDHLYLAASPPDFSGRCCEPVVAMADRAADPGEASAAGTTLVYDFALDGPDATYVGAGEVDGTVRDRWAMDEHRGVLRLAVGPSQQTGNFNSVITMRAEGSGTDARLVEVGRLDDLGGGEQIKAVRWFADAALVVTFRQVDPLYSIDLSDQRRPTLLGTLKIPGYSEYLHPLGERRVVGLGQGPGPRGRWGAQAGLFKVVDLERPKQLDVVSYGAGTLPRAGVDPRQVTWLPATRTLYTVIERTERAPGGPHREGLVSVLRLGDGEMSDQLVPVEYGDDVDAVRLLPLPTTDGTQGRVVLVTGDDVAVFDPLAP